MRSISLLYRVIKNKYLLSVVLFIVWISFFDRNDLITQYDRKKELDRLETSKQFYEGEIARTKKELTDLEEDTRVLEKYAREKFYLKRANEEVFIVTDSSVVKN